MEVPKADEFEEVDFVVENEPWNVYALEDGAILRMKTVLIKVVRLLRADDLRKPFGAETQNIAVVKAPQGYEYLGTQSNRVYSQQELNDAPFVDVNYKILNEDWNSYRLEDDSQLKVKTVVAKIRRLTNLFDRHGIPMYLVDSSSVVNFSAPKK